MVVDGGSCSPSASERAHVPHQCSLWFRLNIMLWPVLFALSSSVDCSLASVVRQIKRSPWRPLPTQCFPQGSTFEMKPWSHVKNKVRDALSLFATLSAGRWQINIHCHLPPLWVCVEVECGLPFQYKSIPTLCKHPQREKRLIENQAMVVPRREQSCVIVGRGTDTIKAVMFCGSIPVLNKCTIHYHLQKAASQGCPSSFLKSF